MSQKTLLYTTWVINKPIIYKFCKDFTNHRKKTNRPVVFTCRPFPPTYLNTGTTNQNFQQSGKQDSFRHLLKSSASIYESSGSQFFRATTGIQSRLGAIDKPWFIMMFLTISGVTEILCSFRLVLEEKAGKKIPESSRLKFLERFLANNFGLSDA